MTTVSVPERSFQDTVCHVQLIFLTDPFHFGNRFGSYVARASSRRHLRYAILDKSILGMAGHRMMIKYLGYVA